LMIDYMAGPHAWYPMKPDPLDHKLYGVLRRLLQHGVLRRLLQHIFSIFVEHRSGTKSTLKLL